MMPLRLLNSSYNNFYILLREKHFCFSLFFVYIDCITRAVGQTFIDRSFIEGV